MINVRKSWKVLVLIAAALLTFLIALPTFAEEEHTFVCSETVAPTCTEKACDLYACTETGDRDEASCSVCGYTGTDSYSARSTIVSLRISK